MNLKRKTKKVRHGLVKLIAPKLYEDATNNKYWNIFSKCPRPMVLFLKEYYADKPLIGGEIGVATGFNSFSMFKELNIKKQYLIDPFLPYRSVHNEYFYYTYEAAKKNLVEYSDRIVFIKDFSDYAVRKVEDRLDFLYIDGCHSYFQVRNDINNYFPLIKKGGVIGGHDFYGEYKGLITAVIEFSNNRGLTYDSLKADWWIIKKER